MNEVTSGPTPTPAAATVAAYSTSRLIPSRCVSLPASRMTYRSAAPDTVIRKLRFVMPPLSVVSTRSRPASSGTRWSAPTSSSYSSPRRTSPSSVNGSSPIRSGAAIARRAASPSSRDVRSADDGLAGRLIGLDVHEVQFAALREEVIHRADDDDGADQRLEDRPRGQA